MYQNWMKALARLLRRIAFWVDGHPGELAPLESAIRPLWYQKTDNPKLRAWVMWPSDASVWIGPFLIHDCGTWPREGWGTDADEVFYIHGYPIFYYKNRENWRERNEMIRREEKAA